MADLVCFKHSHLFSIAAQILLQSCSGAFLQCLHTRQCTLCCSIQMILLAALPAEHFPDGILNIILTNQSCGGWMFQSLRKLSSILACRVCLYNGCVEVWDVFTHKWCLWHNFLKSISIIRPLWPFYCSLNNSCIKHSISLIKSVSMHPPLCDHSPGQHPELLKDGVIKSVSCL